MATNPAYVHPLREMELPDLLMRADDVRDLAGHRGWKLVLECVAAHERKMLAQLLNPNAKPEDVNRLRGEIRGLASAREAAESIVSYAEDAEGKAKRAIQAQEQAHV